MLLFGCGLLASAAVQAQEAQKPNIIYIMCDDMDMPTSAATDSST